MDNNLKENNSLENSENQPTPQPEQTQNQEDISLQSENQPAQNIELEASTPEEVPNETPTEQPTPSENSFTEQPKPFLAEESSSAESTQTPKKENGWIKFLRVLIWLGVAVTLPIGISLKESSELSQALADGTDKVEGWWGDTLVLVALIVGGLNLLWGLIRWILRIKREKCSVGRIIGKLIGGGIWRTLVFTPIIFLSFFVLANIARDSIKQNVFAEREVKLTSSAKIEIAYQNGEISTDEYVNNTLLSYFDSSSLPEKFKGESEAMAPDFARLIEDNYDELSIETKQLFYDIFSFQNVEFGLDASNNEETSYFPSLFSQNAYAKKSEHRVTTLNKAKLSNSGKFVVFYTDTGRDKISDAEAEKACNFLDESVKKYKSNLGLDYEYEKFEINPIDFSDLMTKNPNLYASNMIKNAQNEVLRNSGINKDILDVLETAMPVYIVNPYNETSGNKTVAFYANRLNVDLGHRIRTELGSLTYEENDYSSHVLSYPLITIYPDKLAGESAVSTPAVIAHELGHHYQTNYSYSAIGDIYRATNFTVEGTANMMSINVMQRQPENSLINADHYNGYLKKCSKDTSLDKICPDFLGYPSVAWFENLYEQTGDINGILKMLLSNEELRTAQNIFGVDTMKSTLIRLAERNLTNDYDPAVYLQAVNYSRPYGTTLPCDDFCTKNNSIGYSQISYYYLSASQFKNTTISFSSDDGVIVSLLGLRDGKWVVIESGKEKLKLEISDSPEYSNYALAIINYSIVEKDDGDSYTIKVTKKEIEDLFDEEEDDEEDEKEKGESEEDEEEPDEDNSKKEKNEESEIFGDIFTDGCFELDTDTLLEIPIMFFETGADIAHVAADLSEQDHAEELERIDRNSANIQAEIRKTQTNLSAYKIDVCGNKLKGNTDFNRAKTALLGTLTGGLSILDNKDYDGRTAILAGYNLAQQTGKIYALIQTDKETALITVNVIKR